MIVTRTWMDFCLDYWAFYFSEEYPTEDPSYYTPIDYAKEMYQYQHIQFAIKYY